MDSGLTGSPEPEQLPSVSVVIPTYNRARYLGDAIRSVLEQSCHDLEVIVVDDGSTDDTEQVVSLFGDRIRYLRQENGGRSAARNSGIRHARGEFLVFLDSDDLLMPNKVEAELHLLRSTPDIDVAFGDVELLHENGHHAPFRSTFPETPELGEACTGSQLLRQCPFVIHAAMVRTSAIRDVGGFPEDLHMYEDWYLWTLLALSGSRFLHHDALVGLYRMHPGNTDAVSSIRTQEQSHMHFVLKILGDELDVQLLPSDRQRYHAENMGFVLRSGSWKLITRSLEVVLLPEGRFSRAGVWLLCRKLVSIVERRMQIFSSTRRIELGIGGHHAL